MKDDQKQELLENVRVYSRQHIHVWHDTDADWAAYVEGLLDALTMTDQIDSTDERAVVEAANAVYTAWKSR